MESNYKIGRGTATPLGNSRVGDTVNFSLFSQHATEVVLCLFAEGEMHPFLEVKLDEGTNKTGSIWHVAISGLPISFDYGYRCNGPATPGLLYHPKEILSDPYAKGMSYIHHWGEVENQSSPKPPLGKVFPDHPFNWENDRAPLIAPKDLIIYEMHVRGFTKHASSNVKYPGTFLGIVEKIPYLKELGVNAVELLPVHSFDENEYKGINPYTHTRLKNYWGYSTINFFAPMNHYGTNLHHHSAIEEFKTMVKALHKNNIEVILDVVFNHTAEGKVDGPLYSFRGIDNLVYYIVDDEGRYKDYTGCGNTLNSNHPIVIELILDVLRYWVLEMHVDGFRFDLASALTRGQNGKPLAQPPLIQAIGEDPILGDKIKLIAEPWDAEGLYHVGAFPGGDNWAEWNGRYRDTVRRFIKGTDGQAGEFASVLCGSQHLFARSKSPCHSINFITAHDGFTLRDLVSYQNKHNESNGENNRDGTNENESWNCGKEGPTDQKNILILREKQRRNFHLSLMVSIGTPMLLMGDEYGHTKQGNNNTWCQDSDLNWFLWDDRKKDGGFFRFYTSLIDFRKKHPILKREHYLTPEEIQWHGKTAFEPDWSQSSRFVAYTLKDPIAKQDLYIAFNAYFEKIEIQLPPPPSEKQWYRIVDTSLPSPQDFIADPSSLPPIKCSYTLPPYSALLFKALPCKTADLL